MTLDTQMTLALLQELLLAVRANDAEGFKESTEFSSIAKSFLHFSELSLIVIMPLWNDSVSLDVACLALAAQMP